MVQMCVCEDTFLRKYFVDAYHRVTQEALYCVLSVGTAIAPKGDHGCSALAGNKLTA